MKFKVGDRVRYTGASIRDSYAGLLTPSRDVQSGHLGVIIDAIPILGIPYPYEVQFDNLVTQWPIDEHELELVE